MEPDSIMIGEREIWGRQVPFGLSAADRMRHLYIIGQTGTGKSTLLLELMRQDAVAGAGFCLVDPHGDLSDQVLDQVPRHRTDDVIVIDTDDRERPVAINPFYRVPEDEQPLVATNLISTVKHAWPENWGPRLQYILGNAAKTAVATPDPLRPTLLSIPRLLVDQHFRDQALEHITDAQVVSFWRDEFERWPARLRAEALAPVQNKLGELFGNPFVVNLLCQWRPSFDFAEAMDTGKVVIIRVAKGTLGEEPAKLFGALVVSSIQQAAMRRVGAAAASRRPFHLYIDEFQNFTTDSFAAALSETRKAGLSLTLAHQYISQLSPDLQAAVFGNVGHILSFRVSGSDAEALSREMPDFNPPIFRDLRRSEVCVNLTRVGAVSQPFRGATLPPTQGLVGRGRQIRAQSRMRYGRARGQVTHNLACWLQN